MENNQGRLIRIATLISGVLAAGCVTVMLSGCAEEPMAKQQTVQSRRTVQTQPASPTREQKAVIEKRVLPGGVTEMRIVEGNVEKTIRYVANPASEAASKMTLWEARKVIVDKIPRVISYREKEVGGFLGGSFDITDFSIFAVRVFPYRIEYDYRLARSTRGYTCPQGNPLCSGQQAGTYKLALKRLKGPVVLNRSNFCATSGWCLESGGEAVDEDLVWTTEDDARATANAMNRLRAFALGEKTPEEEAEAREFSQKAAAWRALPVKPAIPEDVRRHRLLAENAIKEQQFDSAIEEYDAGLKINPTWPEGHFNVALLCGELGYHALAIEHMRAYLELVPNAPDAQSARDQIIIWETKIPKD